MYGFQNDLAFVDKRAFTKLYYNSVGLDLLLDETIWNQPSLSVSDLYFTVQWLYYT